MLAITATKFVLGFVVLHAWLARGQDRSSSDAPISACVQNKLKLAHPVPASAFTTDDSLKRLQPALMFATRLCSDRFDEMSNQLFVRLTRSGPRSKTATDLSAHTVDCLRWYLLEKRPRNPIVKLLTLPDHFRSEDCDEIVRKAREDYTLGTPSAGTADDRACIEKVMDRFVVTRFITVILHVGSYEDDLVEEEKKIFTEVLREVTDEVVDCWVG